MSTSDPPPPPPIPVPPEDHHRIHRRSYNHVVVHHRGRVIVWGGERPEEEDPVAAAAAASVYYFQISDHTWYLQPTTGDDVPPRSKGYAVGHTVGHVVGDRLYVIVVGRGGYGGDEHAWATREYDVHFLDLSNWAWTRLEPEGRRPERRLGCLGFPFKSSSWLARGSVFVFGLDDHLAAYDVVRNEWWWPQCSGDAPSVTSGLASFAADDSSSMAYAFGLGHRTGCPIGPGYLFSLDMNSWTWKRLSFQNDVRDGGPRLRIGHTLTLLPQSSSSSSTSVTTAVLYGGIKLFGAKHHAMGDCWMLQLDHSVVANPRWVRCPHLEKGHRAFHAAVFVPDVQQLFLVGGCFINFAVQTCNSRRVLKLHVLPVDGDSSSPALSMATLVAEEEKVASTVRRLAPPSVRDLFDAILGLRHEEREEEEKENAMLAKLYSC